MLSLLAAALLSVPSARAEGTDHARFDLLKGPFADGPAVTRACLKCHEAQADAVMATPHWTWLGPEVEVPGKPGVKRRIGKANLLNNFCIGIQSNEAYCTKCHIGHGWKDKGFDFAKKENVDCLACHDATGTYERGLPADEAPDLAAAARAVGKTSVRTCGACHFKGGGGEAVKHGDLDPSLEEAGRGLDVHMAQDGAGLRCADCHRGHAVAHKLRGHSASVSVGKSQPLDCSECHSEQPHAGAPKGAVLDRHAAKVACPTCHIPTYAREMATKTSWDWSQAGRRDEKGKPVTERDADGNIVYLGTKGRFTWGKDLVPEYAWYDGTNERYLLGEAFDPSKPLVLNRPLGKAGGGKARIWPFKVHRGKQPYDVKNRVLVQPKTAGEKGSGAYWADFDWDKAARAGMSYAGLPYSGELGFAETEMWWPLAHMVAPKEKALACADCHAKKGGRLDAVPGLKLPRF